MFPAAKRGPRTNGPSPRNGRSTPAIRKLADEVLHRSPSSWDLAVADIRPRYRHEAGPTATTSPPALPSWTRRGSPLATTLTIASVENSRRAPSPSLARHEEE